MNSRYLILQLVLLLLVVYFEEVLSVYELAPKPKAGLEFCDGLTTPVRPAERPPQDTYVPRLFPLCIDDETKLEGRHQAMHQSFPFIRDKLNKQLLNQQTHTMDGVRAVFNGYPIHDVDGRVLQRKMFLTFDFTEVLTHANEFIDFGIYLQAIEGGSGLPFGSFHFDPAVLQGAPAAIAEYIFPADANYKFIEECTYMPNHKYDGPNPIYPHAVVWAAGDDHYNRGIRKKFGVIFEYEEPPPCFQTFFFQFIVVIVYHDFGNRKMRKTHAMLSNIAFPPNDFADPPIYQHVPYEHGTGRVHPTPLSRLVRPFHRIVPNLDFEMCVQSNNHIGSLPKPTERIGMICPPGNAMWDCGTRTPVQGTERWRNEVTPWMEVYDTYNSRRPICEYIHPPPPPTTTTTTTTTTAKAVTLTTTTRTTTTSTTTSPTTTTTTPKPLIRDLEVKLTEAAKKIEKAKKITHGDLCIFAWFVLFPPSNYMARFFKDSSTKGPCSLGYWIILHIIAHHLGVLLIWISFGLVMASGEDFFGGVNAIHMVFGVLATVFQMILIFHSMWPRIEKRFTLKDPPVQHVSYGYVAWGMTVFCIFNSNEITLQKQGIVGALVAVTIIANLVGTYIEKRIDKYLGVFPPRRCFPEMERITIDGKTPYTTIKRVWFGIYTVILFGLYLWIAIHQSLFAKNE